MRNVHWPRIRRRFLHGVYPESVGMGVEMGEVAYHLSNLDPFEQYALAAIARITAPRRIFEIGTYDGATALLLARNVPEAEVFTLDLSPEEAHVATVTAEGEHARDGRVGSRFRDQAEAARITQLFGDSTVFDFTPWHGTIDLVLVDACHEYEAAKSDTATALELVAPGGIVVWDDYSAVWPGVMAAVEEAGVPVFHLAKTDFAIYDPAVASPAQ